LPVLALIRDPDVAGISEPQTQRASSAGLHNGCKESEAPPTVWTPPGSRHIAAMREAASERTVVMKGHHR
jgi:hypothetical protein